MFETSDWYQYPENLIATPRALYNWDLAGHNVRLRDDSKRLFVPSEQSIVKVIEAGNRDRTIKDTESLDQYLVGIEEFSGLRIILILQQSSWGSLAISEQMVRKLFSTFQVFPPFLDVLHAFGQKIGSHEEAVTCYQDGDDSLEDSSFECCYIIKHVERHGRPDPTDPWSLRQMGVYHKHSTRGGGDTFIIVNPSRPLQKRLKSLLVQQIPTWKDMHTLLQSSVTVNWRVYIEFLEEKLEGVSSKAQTTTVDHNDDSIEELNREIHFADAQDISWVKEKMLQLKHSLQINSRAFQSINKRRSTLNSTQLGVRPEIADSNILQTKADADRVDNLILRLDSISELIKSILDFNGVDALRASAKTATHMARLAQDENKLIIEIARKTRQDSLTLKTITILTLVYLPASFVATMLSMGYMSVQSTSHGVSVHFKGEMVLFAVLTVVLLLITLGTWKVLDRRYRNLDVEPTSQA